MIDLAEALAPLARFGLDRWGVADAEGWLPVGLTGQRVIVLGSTPAPLWAAFTSWIHEDPRRAHLEHPFDVHVAARLATVDLGQGRWVACADEEAVPLDFRGLAIAAGLGHDSRLGLVLNEVVGPWLGLRAAFVTDTPFAVTPPPASLSPCVG